MIDTAKLKYTKTHEWVRVEGALGTVGITDHAQKEISDVVFVELPKEGAVVKARDSVMVIESVKAAFDIYSPVSGRILKVNQALKDQPQLVNDSPFDRGWLFQIECGDLKELDSLLSEDAYKSSQSASH